MTRRVRRRTRTSDQRALIHLLNQRYHQEFLRAERLCAQLALIEKLRATWLCRAYNWFRDKLRRRKTRHAEATPLAMTPVKVAGRVSIVIPFRDQRQLLHDCLRSLRAGTYRDYEIILVDNGSSDPVLLRLLRRLERSRRYQVLRDPLPFNFSSLCNQGAAAASGDWLLFLNNDTCLLTPDWLERMIAVALQPNVGIVGATLYYPDGTVQHAGMYQREDGVWDHFHRGQQQTWSEVHGVAAVTAACLLIGRSLFESLGGFDEARPVTHNDVALCRRARELGKLVAVTPEARLLHYESLSRGYTLTPVDRA
jgi:GT2 family glycosyltransferase